MTIKILGSQVFDQAIEETSTTQVTALGSVVNGVDETTNLEAQYIYALGVSSTAVGSQVSIDPTAFTTTLSGTGGIAATAMSANVASQYGWYKINSPFVVNGSYDLTVDTLAVTSAFAGKTIMFDVATGSTATLPAASGSGNKFRFVVKLALSSGNYIIKVENASDIMTGNAYVISGVAAAVLGYKTGATDDTITFNGTTTGGLKGDIIEVEDIATNLFAVKVLSAATGTEATPFSATV